MSGPNFAPQPSDEELDELKSFAGEQRAFQPSVDNSAAGILERALEAERLYGEDQEGESK